MVRQRRELRRRELQLTERMGTELVDTLPIRPVIEARTNAR